MGTNIYNWISGTASLASSGSKGPHSGIDNPLNLIEPKKYTILETEKELKVNTNPSKKEFPGHTVSAIIVPTSDEGGETGARHRSSLTYAYHDVKASLVIRVEDYAPEHQQNVSLSTMYSQLSHSVHLQRSHLRSRCQNIMGNKNFKRGTHSRAQPWRNQNLDVGVPVMNEMKVGGVQGRA